MGLDQYGYAVMPHPENTDFAIGWNHDEQDAGRSTLIAQWRKHANLQGFMKDLYLRKCEEQGVEPARGEEGSWFAGEILFNCQPIRLTLADLDELERAVMGGVLPNTTGFFFGESLPEDRADDLAFIAAARTAMRQDMEIYYDSWW